MREEYITYVEQGEKRGSQYDTTTTDRNVYILHRRYCGESDDGRAD